MRAPIPSSICNQISQDAVRYAREAMHGYGWSDKAIQALSAMPGEGVAGIKSSLKYLMHQERGIQPFLMHWVQGRTVPMACKQGDGPHFRRGGHVGEPGYVDIPHVGKVWRDQRWRHPGLQGKHFMQDGLTQAITDNQPAIKAWARSLLGGGK